MNMRSCQRSNIRSAARGLLSLPILFSIGILGLFSSQARAEEIFKIEVGSNYQQYSHADLQKRVWDLERAVWQLQQRVFQLETAKPTTVSDSWICTVTAMNETYTGTGGSKAVATADVIKNCKNGRGGDGFFCKSPKCEN
jgi:hypothetical protein